MDLSALLPNLLIGLREGLEAGLIVTILLATIRKAQQNTVDKSTTGYNVAEEPARFSTAPIWMGIIAAVSVSLSLALVLAFSGSSLSSIDQEILGGTLSLISVVLVSWMIIWMKRSAQSLGHHLSDAVSQAVSIGAVAVMGVAFFSVAREGLETTLFLWANAQASHSTWLPILGALLGLTLAVILCVLLNQRILRFNVGTFFRRTIPFLLILAAGVLIYAIFELQSVGLIPGYHWIAWDLSNHLDASSWWVTLIQGITQITPKMTVLQVFLWCTYLMCMVCIVYGIPDLATHATVAHPKSGFIARYKQFSSRIGQKLMPLTQRHPFLVGVALICVPLLIAGIIISIIPRADRSGQAMPISVGDAHCAADVRSHAAGAVKYMVSNTSAKVMEVNLVNTSDELVAEIETLGPHTGAPLEAVLSPGGYKFLCIIPGEKIPLASPSFALLPSAQDVKAPRGVKQLTAEDLLPIAQEYVKYVKQVLHKLIADTGDLRNLVAVNTIVAAQKQWLIVQSDWENLGAAYDSFGDLAQAVAGLAWGLPQGVRDSKFTGLHRIEYGLWHSQNSGELLPAIDATIHDEQAILVESDNLAIDPVNMPLRGHEILEDAQRDHLTGLTDYGSHAGYTLTLTDIHATRTVVTMLAPLLNQREPHLVENITEQLNILESDLQQAVSFAEPGAISIGALDIAPHDNDNHHSNAMTAVGKNYYLPWALRQKINGDLGQVLELLSALPTVLEVPLERG